MIPSSTEEGARARGKSLSHPPHVGASSGGLATKGKFVPSDPKNTEVGWGVVHLYRDGQETPGLYDDAILSEGLDGEGAGRATGDKGFNEDCTTLCILAVPSYMTPSDLLGYVGEQTREDVSHFRLIKTGRTNKYMVLMKFREANKAREWRKEWNGKSFNSMEVRHIMLHVRTPCTNCPAYSQRTAMWFSSSPSNFKLQTPIETLRASLI